MEGYDVQMYEYAEESHCHGIERTVQIDEAGVQVLQRRERVGVFTQHELAGKVYICRFPVLIGNIQVQKGMGNNP